jgi:hypothetical protein
MAKLQKIETTHYIYEYELSEDELALYNSNPDEFWDSFEEEWEDPRVIRVIQPQPKLIL